MAELIAKTPYETVTGGALGAEKMEVAPFVVREVDPGGITEIAPYHGQKAALSEALQQAHGVPFPDANKCVAHDGATALWFGHVSMVLIGVEADAQLANHGALTDQSDGWAVVDVSGPQVEDVLARLVPIDLRVCVFETGDTARTLLNHMSVSITRTGPDTFRIMVFRSMIKTLFRELHHAMIGVCARRNAVGTG